MRTLLLLPFLLMLVPPSQTSQTGAVADEGALVVVLSSKWSRSRQTAMLPDSTTINPAQAVIPANKNLERNRRANWPTGVGDPNNDTLDGRRAALEKIVDESRSRKAKPVDGFTYRVKIRNASTKAIEVMFWEYEFTESANPANVARRQFLCGVNIKPDKEKELLAFSLSGPSNVISVDSLTKQPENLFIEKVIINRVEYADGTIWQRKDWNFAEMKPSITRALGTPWGTEMCRGI